MPDPKKTPKTAAKDNKDAPASTALRTHTVAAGETLFAISRKYNIQISDIQAFNDLPDNAVLKKGQVLRLEDPTNTAKRPTLADAYGKSTQIIDQTTPPTPPTNTDTPPSTPPKIHTVQKGETLYGIAQKYNVAIGRLQLLNHLKSYTVVLGQKIVLP